VQHNCASQPPEDGVAALERLEEPEGVGENHCMCLRHISAHSDDILSR